MANCSLYRASCFGAICTTSPSESHVTRRYSTQRAKGKLAPEISPYLLDFTMMVTVACHTWRARDATLHQCRLKRIATGTLDSSFLHSHRVSNRHIMTTVNGHSFFTYNKKINLII